ncbi:hypothetical protein D3C78_1012920 [compost metagenome]
MLDQIAELISMLLSGLQLFSLVIRQLAFLHKLLVAFDRRKRRSQIVGDIRNQLFKSLFFLNDCKAEGFLRLKAFVNIFG